MAGSFVEFVQCGFPHTVVLVDVQRRSIRWLPSTWWLAIGFRLLLVRTPPLVLGTSWYSYSTTLVVRGSLVVLQHRRQIAYTF